MLNNFEIAILDFGSQYTHLIARRIRELGVKSHIYPNNVKVRQIKKAVGIVLSGGPKSLVNSPRLKYDQAIFAQKVPILGLCYGHQLIADHFGGQVCSGKTREYGLAKIKISKSPIFKNIKPLTQVWMSHGDHVCQLPPGFKTIAQSVDDKFSALANDDRQIYSFQFHPEVAHTRFGQKMLSNFVFSICGAQKNWSTVVMLEKIQQDIKQQAGDKNIFLLVSGGVDSAVCFALLAKVLGKNRIYALYVDHGLMRFDESNQVIKSLKAIGLNNLHVYQGAKEFCDKLKGIADPESKRKVIGNLFLNITDQVMRRQGMAGGKWLIGQGTIYPDTIESGGTKQADKIKTHHNRVKKIQRLIQAGKIVEPIKDLYKDEVRQIGLKLGLPKKLLFRHPFPGPGLAIRCLCSKSLNNSITTINNHQWKRYGKLYRLPIKSVGVQGDERSYAHPALFAPFKKLNVNTWKAVEQIAPSITNLHKDTNRVILLVGGKVSKLDQSVLTKALLTFQRLDLLRQIDHLVNKQIIGNSQCVHIWQMPVVLLPFGYDQKESVVLRPVESEEAMTVAWAKIKPAILDKMVKKIMALKKVDFVFYDVTNKPPGTIEWE